MANDLSRTGNKFPIASYDVLGFISLNISKAIYGRPINSWSYGYGHWKKKNDDN